MTEPLNQPIRIRCEGSMQPPAGGAIRQIGWPITICAMCGQVVATLGNGTVTTHDRDDVLAMLKRGDYDR